MATPFVDQNNRQAAQTCIAGTFCSEGSESAEGKGKCFAGYYCPPNTFSMIQTKPGSFAEGTGNVAPEKCRPGTYQDEFRQSSCKDCPLGNYCPEQEMTDPIPCKPGTFSRVIGETSCSNCPLGTYSDA